ncbi:MAG: archaemetzincin family Zn-dependent metalloprotease [Candidatus Eremiobacteraeota bacterium]|nr:archaemetzincin family Zn-dependent metalloprotease [Candidatus Eremiobacteraeota bacterium]MBV9647907.1 archaemetzincin family Zn-dependent metalloprotease [Candidatus Eremiobacteraeota bacterium]
MQHLSQIGIVPINGIDASFLTRLALCLEERFLFTCSVERPVGVPPTALNSVRRQLFLNTLLSRVAAALPQSDGYRMVVTDFDLYKTSHQFIFGEGNEDNRVAAISLHRLRTEFYGEQADQNLLFQRALKEAVHNIGHALGLRHCYNARCAMFLSGSIYDTDNKLSHFCEVCERRMRKAMAG